MESTASSWNPNVKIVLQQTISNLMEPFENYNVLLCLGHVTVPAADNGVKGGNWSDQQNPW